MTMLSFRLTDEQVTELDQWTETLSLDRSAFVRDALRRRISELTATAGVTGGSLVSHPEPLGHDSDDDGRDRIDRRALIARGVMALPESAVRRWGLWDSGGAVEAVDLGPIVVVAPDGEQGLRALVWSAVEAAGGYDELVRAVAAQEPDLA
jgi:Arc/MetJ-type ribon-helix-helix transcriptional regulator